jgi:hypothetical protein
MMSRLYYKVDLVFADWQRDGYSVYNTERGIELSNGDFHSGTTFECAIHMGREEFEELCKAISEGYEPLFRVYIPPEETQDEE